MFKKLLKDWKEHEISKETEETLWTIEKGDPKKMSREIKKIAKKWFTKKNSKK